MSTSTISDCGCPPPEAALTIKDFRSNLKPIWCPGCGDYGVVTALYRALVAIGRPAHEVAFISGIGCSSRIPGYTTAYGFNTVHGRALPVAQGIKMANPDLLVLCAGGDGDGFSIGGGHVPHAIRRNLDITYIVMDNHIYGLTKGQLSPTTPRGAKTPSSSHGSMEDPVNPLLYVLAYGAGFVAQHEVGGGILNTSLRQWHATTQRHAVQRKGPRVVNLKGNVNGGRIHGEWGICSVGFLRNFKTASAIN